MTSPIASGLLPDYDRPSAEDMMKAQFGAKEAMREDCCVRDGGFVTTKHGAAWIPNSDHLMQLRLLIAAHARPGGHRGIVATEAAISKFGQWTTMWKDVQSIVSSCFHCLSTTILVKISRPMAQTLRAVRPNKLLYSNFCSLDTGSAASTTYSSLKTIQLLRVADCCYSG